MSDLRGTIPPANDRSRPSGRDKALHPFDGDASPGEKWRARNKYSNVIWPFVLGLVLALFSPKLRDLLSDVNPWAARLVFPFVLLVERPEFGLQWDFGGHLPQVVLFLQFPVEGLLTMLSLRLHGRLSFAFAPLIFIHLAGAFVLFLLIQAHS
jgi:hypothetical protein